MNKYVKRCCISKEECAKVKEEIYSMNKDSDVADKKWERIIEIMLLLGSAKWYFAKKDINKYKNVVKNN